MLECSQSLNVFGPGNISGTRAMWKPSGRGKERKKKRKLWVFFSPSLLTAVSRLGQLSEEDCSRQESESDAQFTHGTSREPRGR